jgi:hypothetical protein
MGCVSSKVHANRLLVEDTPEDFAPLDCMTTKGQGLKYDGPVKQCNGRGHDEMEEYFQLERRVLRRRTTI